LYIFINCPQTKQLRFNEKDLQLFAATTSYYFAHLKVASNEATRLSRLFLNQNCICIGANVANRTARESLCYLFTFYALHALITFQSSG